MRNPCGLYSQDWIPSSRFWVLPFLSHKGFFLLYRSMDVDKIRSGVYFRLYDESLITPVGGSGNGSVLGGAGNAGGNNSNEDGFRFRVSLQGQLVLIGTVLPTFWLDSATGSLFYSDEDVGGVSFPSASLVSVDSFGVLSVGGE